MAEYRFRTPEPVELESNVPVGAVEVETVDGDESTVVVEGNEQLVEQTRVELRGRVLVVEFRGKKPLGITISLGDFSFGNARLDVRAWIPHASRARLTGASADMELRGSFDSLDAKSASGDLSVSGEIEHDATVKTVSGNVRIERVGGELRVQSVSGDTFAGSVGGPVGVKSVSGDVRVESVREGHVVVQSVSGDVAVGVERGTNVDVDAGSVSGDLASEIPLDHEPGAARGDGPTVAVRGKTVSGDFRVFRAA